MYSSGSGIVKTKLYVPRLPGNFIYRPRLINQINQGLQHNSLMIAAPAGFGKSTLLAEWAHQSKMPVCWLSLDNSENDPRVLFSNIISSVQTQFPGFGSSIQTALNSPGTPHLYSLIDAMTNEISDINQDFAFIMDDFHQIESTSSIEAVNYLVDHQPPNLYLIVAGRKETPVFGIRRHVHGEFIHLGIDDLRFNSTEILKFFRSRFGTRISGGEIAILENRTEGWIAGLQMAAISMQSVDDLKAFVSEFDGANRIVTDYLVDEVLSHQETELQDFLLKTSILRELSAPLCDHLMDIKNSQGILETLERRSLFLIPLDNTRTWYRYHHLFADLLHNRLQVTFPDQVSALHERASDWYLAHDMPEDAVEQIFANHDYQLIVQRIEQVSGVMLANGRFQIFIEWLNRIPKWYLERKDYLLLVQAVMLFELSDIPGCQCNLEIIGNRWVGFEAPDSEKIDEGKATLYGVFEAVRSAYYYGGEGDVEKSYRSAETALKYLPEDMSYWRALAGELVGLYHQWQGNYDTSIEYFQQATELTLKDHNLFLGVIAISILAKLYLKTGRLLKAIEVCQKAIDMDSSAGFKVAYSGLIYLTLAELYYLRGDFEAAERNNLFGIDLVEKHQDVHSIIQGYFNLSRIYISRNKTEKAQDMMAALVSKIRDFSPSRNAITRAFACQAYIWIYTGNIKLAKGWMEKPDHDLFDVQYPFDVFSRYAYRGAYLAPQDPVSEFVEFVHFTEARLHYSIGDFEVACRIIDNALVQTGNQRRTYSRIRFLILKAMVQFRLDHLNDATAALLEAINIATPENLCQPFVQEGYELSPILDKIVKDLQGDKPLSIQNAYHLKFVEHIHSCIDKTKKSSKKTHPYGLTAREIQVIQWLARGLSYSETALQMSISENTLRTHIERVYSKLGVNNRLQAVSKAEKMKLLDKSHRLENL